MRTILLAIALLAATLGTDWMGAAAAGVPEATGVVQRYDSARKVIYIDGQQYLLVGDAVQTLAAFLAEHGATALHGRNIAYNGGRDEHGRLYIDTIAF